MTGPVKTGHSERSIVSLKLMTRTELEARYRLLMLEPPPEPMTRAQLLAALAYETVRLPHRKKKVRDAS